MQREHSCSACYESSDDQSLYHVLGTADNSCFCGLNCRAVGCRAFERLSIFALLYERARCNYIRIGWLLVIHHELPKLSYHKTCCHPQQSHLFTGLPVVTWLVLSQ